MSRRADIGEYEINDLQVNLSMKGIGVVESLATYECPYRLLFESVSIRTYIEKIKFYLTFP